MAPEHEVRLPRVQVIVLNVSLVLNILLMGGMILGGLNWAAGVNADLALFHAEHGSMRKEISDLKAKMEAIQSRHDREDGERAAREQPTKEYKP